MIVQPIESAKKYFDSGRVMQLGTVHNGQPRVNSVYYVVSSNYSNVYWMSEPQRRHSKDLRSETRVAGAIAIKVNSPVIGLQFTGEASIVENVEEMIEVVRVYNQKYNYAAKGFIERFSEGKNKHLLYKMTIKTLELFDEQNFTGDPLVVEIN